MFFGYGAPGSCPLHVSLTDSYKAVTATMKREMYDDCFSRSLRGKSLRTPLWLPRCFSYGNGVSIVVLLLGVLTFGSRALTAQALNPIQQENSLPGTPGWDDFAADLQPDLISGFGSKISVNRGDSIDFYVTTTAPNFTIDVFRTGYYQGIGARLIQSLGSFTGIHQAIPPPDRVT